MCSTRYVYVAGACAPGEQLFAVEDMLRLLGVCGQDDSNYATVLIRAS